MSIKSIGTHGSPSIANLSFPSSLSSSLNFSAACYTPPFNPLFQITIMVGISEAKCVLVLGATSGIGRSLAQALHDLPSKPTVIVSGRRKDRLEELCKQGERFRPVQVDINTTRDVLKTFVADVLREYPDVSLSLCC